MPVQHLHQLRHPQRNVRLDTLTRLRWLAVAGQTAAVLVVNYVLDFDVPLAACAAVIAMSAWLNVALRLRFRVNQRLEPDRAAWLLPSTSPSSGSCCFSLAAWKIRSPS